MTTVVSTYPEFPKCPSYGFSVQPVYLVKVVSREQGYERVDRRWARALHSYTSVPMGDRDEADIYAILTFWHAMGGMKTTFIVKDYTDFKSCQVQQTADELDQPLVFVSTGLYRLVKRYKSGTLTQDREITCPLGSTITIANTLGALQDAAHYTVDENTGLLKVLAGFVGTPGTWGGEFNVPVRFNSELQVELSNKAIQNLSFSLMEKRIALATSLSSDPIILQAHGSAHMLFRSRAHLLGNRPLGGTAHITFGASGNASGLNRIHGTAHMVFAATGSPTRGALRGTASMVFGGSGSPTKGGIAGKAHMVFGASGTLTPPPPPSNIRQIAVDYSRGGDVTMSVSFPADTLSGSVILAFYTIRDYAGNPVVTDGVNTYSTEISDVSSSDGQFFTGLAAIENAAVVTAGSPLTVDWSAFAGADHRGVAFLEVTNMDASAIIAAVGQAQFLGSDDGTDSLDSGTLNNPTAQDVAVIGISFNSSGGDGGDPPWPLPLPGSAFTATSGGTGWADQGGDPQMQVEDAEFSSSGNHDATFTPTTVSGSQENYTTLGIMLKKV